MRVLSAEQTANAHARHDVVAELQQHVTQCCAVTQRNER
jgi:hypothetical protein